MAIADIDVQVDVDVHIRDEDVTLLLGFNLIGLLLRQGDTLAFSIGSATAHMIAHRGG